MLLDGRRAIAFGLLVGTLIAPGIAAAETARDILDAAREKQLERWQGVDSFVKTEETMGHRVTTHYVRTIVETADGRVETIFLPQSPDQAVADQPGQAQRMTPEQMEAYADALAMTGNAMSDEIGNGLEDAGLPRNLFKSMSGDPWVSPDPGTMMGGMSDFMRASAEGQREMAAERERDKHEAVEGIASFRETAELVGTEDLDGRRAYHLRAEGLDQVQEVGDGQTFTLQSVSLWLDTSEYVPLRTRTEGVLSEGRQQRPAAIEQISSDYHQVAGGNLYEPHRQTMKLDGMMSEAEKAEMREAQKQLAEAEAQMATLPPDQRAMMQRMMGGQLEAMRKMAADGGFRIETVVTDIQINPHLVAGVAPGGGPAEAASVGATPPGSAAPVQTLAAGASPSSRDRAQQGDSVLRIVQERLTTLGYETGNTDGFESTETAIAISQFQAEKGLEVTGTASPQLAGILGAEIGRQQGEADAKADAAAVQAAQQACLQQKIAQAQANQQKKRGFGRLAGAVGRIAMGSGNYDVARTANEVYGHAGTAEDLAQAAKDLGITEDDIEACKNAG